MSWRIGVDIGGTFTDVVLAEEARGAHRRRQGADDAARLRPGRARRLARGDARPRRRAGRRRVARARDDRGHQCAARGQGRAHRARHHARLPRRARAAPLGAGRASTTCSRTRPPCSCPATGASRSPSGVDAQGAVVEPLAPRGGGRRHRLHQAPRRRGGGGVPALLVPQRHARARHRRAAAGGASRSCRVPVVRGAARDPRVRAHEHHRGVRLRGPDPRLVPRPPGVAPSPSMGLPAPLRHGLERRRLHAWPRALRMPAMAVESGPAAGVIAAALVGRRLGLANVISFDMGGTTAKASLIERGEINDHVGVRGRRRRQRAALAPRHRPSDPRARHRPGRGQRGRRQHRLDRSGRRAARRPGERGRRARARSATGRAARGPTVTDADLVLGYLNPVALLGGALPVRPRRARGAAIEARDRAAARARRARGRGRASWTWSTPAWPPPCASSPSSAATTRASSPWSPSAAPGPCTPRGSPRSSRSRASSSRPSPAASPRLASSRATCGATTRRRSTPPLAAASPPQTSRRVRRPWRPRRATMLTRAGVPRGALGDRARRRLRYGRQAYELTVPVAPGPVTRGHPRAPRRRLPRQAPHDVRPRQPRTSPSSSSTCAWRRWAGWPASISARPRTRHARRGRAAAGARDARTSRRPGSCAATCSRRDALAPGAASAGPADRRVDGHHRRRPAGLARPARRRTGASSILDGTQQRRCADDRSRHLRGGEERAVRAPPRR